jgi:hypothetical protein
VLSVLREEGLALGGRHGVVGVCGCHATSGCVCRHNEGENPVCTEVEFVVDGCCLSALGPGRIANGPAAVHVSNAVGRNY